MFNESKFDEFTKNVTYNVTFVPKSQSRNKDNKTQQLNYIVKLVANGVSHEFEYSMGVGCITNEERASIARLIGFGSTVYKRQNEARIHTMLAETGTIKSPDLDFRIRKVENPKLNSIICCLLLDSDALNYSDFEEWADSIGYDVDSRSAHDIYSECVKTGIKLRRMFGETKLQELSEMFQDF